MPARWQTGTLAGDNHRRIVFLQRCIRNEQQRNQHRAYECKKARTGIGTFRLQNLKKAAPRKVTTRPSLDTRQKPDRGARASRGAKANARNRLMFPEFQFQFQCIAASPVTVKITGP